MEAVLMVVVKLDTMTQHPMVSTVERTREYLNNKNDNIRVLSNRVIDLEDFLRTNVECVLNENSRNAILSEIPQSYQIICEILGEQISKAAEEGILETDDETDDESEEESYGGEIR